MSKKTVKQRVSKLLSSGHDKLASLYTNGRSNVGQTLYDLCYWQSVVEEAKTNLERTWSYAQADDGPLDNDKDLRNNGVGEFFVAESEHFSLLVKVQEPRMVLDQELFITALCTKYKLTREEVHGIAEQCRVPTRAPLSKKVLEAS